MWMSLVFGLPYLVAVVVGGLICLLAGPKGPASRPWRVPAVVGFGLLVLQHLVQMGQTMLLYAGTGPGAYYRSGLFQVIGVLGSIISLVGLLLIAIAVVRGRGAAVPAPLRGWGPQVGPAEHPPGQGAPPVVTPDNPYGQRQQPARSLDGQPPVPDSQQAPQPAPQQHPSTGGDEHPEQLSRGR